MATLEELENKYKGERLFILGTGPSLLDVDLSLLKDSFTFGLNALMTRYEPPFIPTFYGFKERLFSMTPLVRQSIDIILKHPNRSILFVNDDRVKDGSSWIAGKAIHAPVSTSSAMSDTELWWRRWARFNERGMVGHTVALDHGAQLGYYMGFNPIYMLGCELTARAGTTDRILQASRLSAHVAAEKLAERDIHLINLSQGCTVDMPIETLENIL